jgi:hypothetical protein
MSCYIHRLMKHAHNQHGAVVDSLENAVCANTHGLIAFNGRAVPILAPLTSPSNVAMISA